MKQELLHMVIAYIVVVCSECVLYGGPGIVVWWYREFERLP